MSQTRIVIIPPAASMPAPFLTFDAGGRVLQRGSLLLEDSAATLDVRTVAVAPGADVLVRWLDLPVGGTAQVRAAARWALKDDLAGDPERTVVALGPVAGEGPRLVAAGGAGLLEAWIAYLAALGVPPVAIVPDCLILPAPADDALSAAVFGADMGLRSAHFAATVQSDLVEAVAGGRSAGAGRRSVVGPGAQTRGSGGRLAAGGRFGGGSGGVAPDPDPRRRRARSGRRRPGRTPDPGPDHRNPARRRPRQRSDGGGASPDRRGPAAGRPGLGQRRPVRRRGTGRGRGTGQSERRSRPGGARDRQLSGLFGPGDLADRPGRLGPVHVRRLDRRGRRAGGQ